MLINQSDLDFINLDQVSAMPDTASIYRKTATNGPLGTTESYTLIGTSICRIAPIGDRKSESIYQEDEVHNIQAIEYLHVATFPKITNIDIIDRVVVSGKTFEVTAILTRNSYETAKRLMVIQVIS